MTYGRAFDAMQTSAAGRRAGTFDDLRARVASLNLHEFCAARLTFVANVGDSQKNRGRDAQNDVDGPHATLVPVCPAA